MYKVPYDSSGIMTAEQIEESIDEMRKYRDSKVNSIKSVVGELLSDNDCLELVNALSIGCVYEWCDQRGYDLMSLKGKFNTNEKGYALTIGNHYIKMPVSIHNIEGWELCCIES